jgi:hypothetical protein
MNILALPPEILLAISLCLANRPYLLSIFCQTSKDLCHHIRPILYEHVRLDSSVSLMAFCRTAITHPASTVAHVRSLQIGKAKWVHMYYDFQICRHHALDLREALLVMPNLRDLSLDISTKASNIVFNGLRPFFKLDRFSYSSDTSLPLMRFLVCSQPSLTQLESRGSTSYESHGALLRYVHAMSSRLPCLNDLSGDYVLVSVLSPLRPIRSATITYWTPLYLSELLGSSLTRTSIPLRTLCLIENSWLWGSWTDFINSLRSARLNRTICEIHISVTINVCLTSNKLLLLVLTFCRSLNAQTHGGLNLVSKLKNRVAEFSSFTALETFKLSPIEPINTRPIVAKRWLGDMGKVSAWIGIAPSLKRVVIYGLELQ